MKMTEDEMRDMLESFIKEVNNSCQSKKLSKLYVTELPADGKWIISFGMPDFQQTDDVHSMEVDESTGIEILEIQSFIDTSLKSL